jgi:hypothetical protein
MRCVYQELSVRLHDCMLVFRLTTSPRITHLTHAELTSKEHLQKTPGRCRGEDYFVPGF